MAKRAAVENFMVVVWDFDLFSIRMNINYEQELSIGDEEMFSELSFKDGSLAFHST